MESDYDRKFEEMKEYIPFLESMIKRLENTCSASVNPRQAQLDKIRSLRDLLLDKKKRMKMENLLKCEQVLVNLYAKVEQRDTLPGIKKASEPLYPSDASTESPATDLNLARSKLKTVAETILPENDANTLPEIAPACETEVVCTPGSKEPALFQRRPNKNSRSPPAKEGSEKKSPITSVPKRNYTRVLVSPEPSPRRWTTSEDPGTDKPLFSRRSSRNSPKKSSPQKKVKKMSSKSKAKDFNIILNVPEESIDSLNTGDIFSRIINCPDNDVDIDTLRDMRTQILGELKKTGTKNDISDLILKSYKKKKKNKQIEIEEGELSDSESEAIESIYGSLVVVGDDKNKPGHASIVSTEKEKQGRKIRLVINYDKQKPSTSAENEVTDFEVFDIEKNEENKVVEVPSRRESKKVKQSTNAREQSRNTLPCNKNHEDLLTIEVEDDDDKQDDTNNIVCKDSDSSCIDILSSDNDAQSPKVNEVEEGTVTPFKANFYKEQKQLEKNTASMTSSEELSKSKREVKDKNSVEIESENRTLKEITPVEISNENKKSSENEPSNCDKPKMISTNVQEKSNENLEEHVEVPLLNTEPVPVKVVSTPAKVNVVSEIDILQALKNEILSESITIPGSDVATPLLHQPKVTKVASAQEIMTKKRISIEKYKAKSTPTRKQSLFLKDPNISQSSDNSKKTSLKLTEQEQQRFNFPPLALDSSDEETTNYLNDDVYADLAPRSPENNEKITAGPSTPIIIPTDPVKSTTAASMTDVDMRTLMPTLSPNAPKPVPAPSIIPFSNIIKNKISETNSEKQNEKHAESRRAPLLDPRVRREFNNTVGNSPNSHTKKSVVPPNLTPNSRPFETTPSRQSFDLSDSSGHKHVYAPFPAFEPRDKRERSVNRDTPGPRWEPNSDPVLEDRNSRWDLWKDTDLRDTGRSKKWDDRNNYRNRSSENRSDQHKSRYDAEKYKSGSRGDTYSHEQKDDYSYSRMDCPTTPIHPFGRSECPTTPIHPFGRSDCPTTPSHPFGRTECPTTPIHPFGRNDGPLIVSHPFGRTEAPMTPSHPFGRSEAPMTPSHPFGRSEAPMTPSHSFGRSDAPMTPSHSFGRSEAPMTPNHPFGRSDAPMTPSHSFGRSEAPMTPSHPFGRSEAPMTPSHSFGRSDAPMTPGHSFGRSDAPFGRPEMGVAPRTPSHPFGRSEYQHVSGPKLVKDPRLNRIDTEQKSRQYDEDKGICYKDRQKPDLSNKTYNKIDSYRNYRERTPGRESSASHRDNDHNLLYTRDRGRSNDYRRECDRGSKVYYEEGPRREYHRSQSVGRSAPVEERYNRASSRGPSDNGANLKQINENTLSVKPKSGRSFIIDTSVNTTFQEFLSGKGLQVFDYSFNSRRQRAASVGRTIIQEKSTSRNVRDNSVGRTMSKPSFSIEQDTSGYKKMVNFVRARSMGRELVDPKEKSFKEVKAELRSYQAAYTRKETKNIPDKKVSNRDSRSKKDQFEKKQKSLSHKKTVYSPRKNYRDPRMHRDSYYDGKNKSRHEDKKKHYGIVYSSDNIAKGILGSGYGVKNYKIPKIKKPVEEKDTKNLKVENKKEILMADKIRGSEVKVKEKEVSNIIKQNSNKSLGDVKKDKVVKTPVADKKKIEIVNKSRKESTKKATRRAKLADTTESEEETITKTRKAKKVVIDSDSESDSAIKQKETSDTPKTYKKTEAEMEYGKNTTNEIEDIAADKLNCSFGMDDLENIFPDNMNSDPVLDNINALIADLDNDIDTTKAENFTKNITIDNMFESIDSPENNIDNSLKDINDVISNLDSDPTQIQQTISDNNVTIPNPERDTNAQSIACNIEQLVNNQCQSETIEPLSMISIKKHINYDNLSGIQDNTIQNSNQSLNPNEVVKIDTNKAVEKNYEINENRSSTPDSTLNTNPVELNKSYDEEGLADSTNEKHDSLHDVSSTHDQTETPSKDNENSSIESSVSSIGNLLSMLQDKSKIKELLSMLGEAQSGDNEKIKKKLEKLSEIVSDDDDINDVGKDKNIKKDVQEEPEVTDTNADDSVKSDSNLTVKPDVEVYIGMARAKEPHEPDTNLNVAAEDTTNVTNDEQNKSKKVISKGRKTRKVPLRGKKGKWKVDKNNLPAKRVTRSEAANLLNKPKKPSRELKQLQESIKEMFIKDDILNATGIRMCRLAKLVDEKNPNQEEDSNTHISDTKPVVVIEKIKENVNTDEKQELKTRKKPGPKPKVKVTSTEEHTDGPSRETKIAATPKYKPGPKSKTKHFQEDSDPYSFDDSVSESTTVQTSEQENESETEDDSIASSKSFGSSEVLAELKKRPKRKKRGWQSGIIKKRRKKNESKLEETLLDDSVLLPNKEINIPDMNCFTDKSYCFLKNVTEYPCRLCEYNGLEIVKHYKTDHPHTEIPLSRMNAVVAREAIDQCEDVNFQAIIKMPTEKYICCFCFEVFGKKLNVLEEFFWHVVSMHTGEYKRLCSECVNVTRCPFNLDIPPPPKDLKSQLIGYICGRCYFTQISLENLKTHVIVRHNDEQTAVFTINLAVMSRKAIQKLMKCCNTREQAQEPRTLRSKANVAETSESSDAESKLIKKDCLSKSAVRTKLSFENDDSISVASNTAVKVENEDNDNNDHLVNIRNEETDTLSDTKHDRTSSDIIDIPHFKISYASSGTKEYVCAINGIDHYKTNLLISMKKHVQYKHSEIWDGYCSVCKVIVMPQGIHQFKECLQHMLDKHMDNFPVLLETESKTAAQIEHPVNAEQTTPDTSNPTSERAEPSSPTYITARAITELLSLTPMLSDTEVALPKIQNVVSLGTTPEPQEIIESDRPPTIFKCPLSVQKDVPSPEEPYKYEEMQTEVMSKKHLVILDSMLTENKLVQIFKCAGRYCSFTTDSPDAALLHASTHQRIGGENALLCSYCDYDCNNNAIDLVMHVFKMHGCCPYVCGRCFYRAVASQLVLAHIHRVHGGTGIVLQTETVSPGDDNSLGMLPREVAVQYYICYDAQNKCRFKTYTHGKFIEHLMKHTPPYMCYICSLGTNSHTELIQHFKTHGLKLYQCTWCVEGGDNEGDFLAHSSARHPTRQPQAYLRIITNSQTGGGAKTMVLPLAKLNKSTVPTRVITPEIRANNPAREAEKSLDMEKLMAAMPTITIEPPPVRSKTPIQIPTSQLSPQTLIEEQVTDTVEQRGPSRTETPPPLISQAQDDNLPTTPVLKTEPIDESSKTNFSDQTVISLDSDDDEDSRGSRLVEKSKQNVIDLSDDDRTAASDAEQNKKVDLLELYKCNNCKTILKSAAGFRRHVIACFLNQNNNYSCGHCPFTTDNMDSLLYHYNMGHSLPKPLYTCGICYHIDKSLYGIKTHIKKDHGMSNVSMTSNPDGSHVVIGTTRGKSGPKRKLSGGPVSEKALKRIRYGAQDLYKLPQKPILDELAYCYDCEFSTKVRLNLVRHIQQHADNQLVPQTAPVNPVPHLETNEKHFDKMINLASSSLETGRGEKATPSVTLHIPPEAASPYPKYVPDRQRYTCGAKGCSYISLDEAMLKIHWETLHASSNDFHCVHCPPNQYLDTSKPLTASRIIAHLKMHDIRLYACSLCTHYHYRKQVVEKHLAETHKGSGQLMIVREESTNVSTSGTSQATNAAPTMDLKPWKCGLCAFKSMLRPEVIDHCSKMHSTKMQFKCPVCPFRTSTLENVTKHQTKSHPENKEDVFYYYYREGSIPDDPDGTPRWVKQRQKMGNLEPEVKTEAPETAQQLSSTVSKQSILPSIKASSVSYNIDLDIVKKEVVDPIIDEPMVALCRRFGDKCDPNGLKFKCPLCLTVTEDNKEAMRSHLYEELQYRKWACSICCYKAFHKNGLHEHMVTEHRQNRAIEPIELDADTRVERWVNEVLEHQTAMIETNKNILSKQKPEQGKPSTSAATKPIVKPAELTVNEKNTENLIQAFGHLGAPNNVNFCCPKCEYQTADEAAMKDHLQTELNKIRWRCSSCYKNSQTYHEAQLHSKTCKSTRPEAARPVEAIRDPAVRAAWLAAVIRAQKSNMKQVPDPETEPMDEDMIGPLENSLLVVRYEERFPTPEVEMIGKKKRTATPQPAAAAASPDSDDERLVIDVPSTDDADTPKKNEINLSRKCVYCPFSTKYQQQLDYHLLRHYNLKPMTCCYCEQTHHYSSIDNHMLKSHPNLPKRFRKTPLPSGPPLTLEFFTNKKQARKRSSSSNEELPKTTQIREEVKKYDGPKLICLVCEKAVSESETASHTHDKPTYFAPKGEVVVKCCVCLSLLPNINIMQEHNNQFHPNNPINYAYFKLNHHSREILQCGHCTKRFKFFRDLKIHHNVLHNALQLKYESRPYYLGAYDFECETDSKGESSKTSDNSSLPAEPIKAAKKVARKSTTKLPSQTVARKSTTKLPINVDSDSESEYSHYGNKPAPLDQYENVTTLMPIYNSKISLQKLNKLIKINPVVLVKDIKKGLGSD